MKILRIVSRIIVGLVFMFSGTVKAVDPLGSAYKFSDYFQAFHLEFLQAVCSSSGYNLIHCRVYCRIFSTERISSEDRDYGEY